MQLPTGRCEELSGLMKLVILAIRKNNQFHKSGTVVVLVSSAEN